MENIELIRNNNKKIFSLIQEIIKICREEAQLILRNDTKRAELLNAKETYFSLINKQLETYIEKNPEKLFILGESPLQKNDKNRTSQEEHIIDFQKIEINFLNKILTQTLESHKETVLPNIEIQDQDQLIE